MVAAPIRDAPSPNGWVVVSDDIPPGEGQRLADAALTLARQMAPRVSGDGARGMRSAFGEGWFGIYSTQSYMVHQNEGTRPRVMRELAGKTIPMWITDRDGSMTAGIPAERRVERTRVTEDGRRQVLIFRKAAPIGSTKTRVSARGRRITVPRAYPGAPRRGPHGYFSGVHWRHPGLRGRQFVQDALVMVAERARVDIKDLYPAQMGA